MRYAVVQLAPFTEQRREQLHKEQVCVAGNMSELWVSEFWRNSAHALAHGLKGAHIFPLYTATPTQPCHQTTGGREVLVSEAGFLRCFIKL